MKPSEPAPTLRVLCVDDNPLVADALQRRLSHEPGLEWAGCVSEGEQILPVIRSSMPHVVLMDIDMPGVETFGIVQQIAGELPHVRVVMFSGHVRLDYIERAFDCGAWGYLSKNEEAASLIDAIRLVGTGQIVLSKEVAAVQQSVLPPTSE